MSNVIAPEQPQSLTTTWPARLELVFESRPEKTVLTRSRHLGPLRVQRAFYPEGGRAHIYILHPPGGMVSGDDLLIAADARDHSQVLLTTPAAGKVYRARANQQWQRQVISLSVGSHSCLEWLPQETIIFQSANVELKTEINLAKQGDVLGWDIICLARPSCDESFDKGTVVLDLTIKKMGRAVLIEKTRLNGGEEALAARWGLSGNSVLATFYATLDCSDDEVDGWRQRCEASGIEGRLALTYRKGILIGRYLGAYAEPARQMFELLWSLIRQHRGLALCRPRIWNT
ncbi:Urease accessory protein UreD [Sinobacterium norvegicum]|uniref:Urease accessory protein UreD n=1 Tax=Sinobacterium norvegicum TaxID=1641715 RepID=A0ABM9AEM2_9GAMM|nr:urease accessory protein UreD [Sinobacterium norvegicum]CAH0991649.1 Urease accessory protein UreD [Sinobacterium norvegicum]